MVDSFGREIDYLRVSVTDRCNFRCIYCMPEEGIDKCHHSEILSFEDIEKIIDILTELGISKIRITGGEPLVRKGCSEFIQKLAKNKTIDKLCLTTNGVYLKNYIDVLKKANLYSLNISLDTLNKNLFKEITRNGKLDDVLESISKISEIGAKTTKLNVVLLKGINDDKILEFVSFARAKNLILRFIELMPFSPCKSYEKYGITADEIINKYNLCRTSNQDYSNNVETYKFSTGEEVGFIRPISSKFCFKCNRLRLTTDGKLMLCLHGNLCLDLKKYLNDENEMKKAILDFIKRKPKEHQIDLGILQNLTMNEIGG